MYETLLSKYGVRQLGFYVKSIEETAAFMAKHLGAGPFFDMGVNELAKLQLHGADCKSLTRCALGHMNDVQVELIEPANDEPSVYTEAGGFGLHHICLWTDDLAKTIEEFKAEGVEVAMEMISGQGLPVVYLDTVEELGVYVEVNPPLDQLYQGIKMQHESWDGTRPLRSVAELMGK